ncbi:putative LPS assembly protein LptD [Neptunitalea lumnitzerae]|uniref:Organic solvent tolerance protein OstA n=1 Tax=Neptunitalea lumnitzerae TaxID=2965509 RepID=A0ABQ5MLC9_9FLAO|nr:putative LPS assembly protein LptD [Neptunitalea sp. Y10]GLB50207.1 organic solvent tolerance protein OstA [Neptunitalea sp. Y10]
MKYPEKSIYFIFLFLFLGFFATAQETGDKNNVNVAPSEKFKSPDPLVVETQPLTEIEGIEVVVDSSETDTLPKKKPLLTSKVIDNAKGYRKYNVKENKIYLYDDAYLKYGDMELNAGQIIVDLNKNEAYAKGIVDSTGTYTQLPVFNQGGQSVNPDSLLVNIDTQKGLVYGSRTVQGEMNVRTEIVKKENDTLYYIYNTKLTTSSHPDDDPEYYIKIDKGVLVPGVKVIAGVSQMFFYDVPTPIVAPFAFFPMTSERKSGLIFPTFGEGSRGYFIQNGGYYFAISDYVDLALQGDYYTNGSYGFSAQSAYSLRYKFSGNFNINYENLISGQKGFSNYGRTSIYNIRWSHSQDAKASANSRFSASVNLGSSRYYQQSLDQSTTSNFLNNTMSSSISYSKTFPEYPSVNLSLTATHSQNTNTEVINMTLPTLQASVERIYPFAPANGAKKGIFQNINFQYSVNAKNEIQTVDSLFFKKEMFEDAELGFRHSIPVTTNFKLFKYLSASLNFNYTDVWQFQTVRYNDYDNALNEATIDTVSGFDRFGTYNFGASLGTTLYGTFNFGEDKKIQAIRHVVRPSVSYAYTPSFDNYYDYYIADAEGTVADYTRFNGGMYGSPGRNLSNTVSFSLNNTLEAKVRDKDSTATEPKKIKLLNNLNFSTGYNIAADSLAWSPLTMTGSTNFFDNKMTVNFGATFDPYAIDASGTRIEQFNIDNGGSLFRLTKANLTTNYSFSSKSFKKKNKDDDEEENPENQVTGGRTDDLFGQNQDFSNADAMGRNKKETKEIENENYSNGVPWDLKFAYSLTYSNPARQQELTTNSLMFSGNIELSPRWKVGVSSGYDFKEHGFTYTQFRFQRDLESWQLNFNWVPFSARSSWYFFIGINSSVLSDLKWEKRRPYDQNL